MAGVADAVAGGVQFELPLPTGGPVQPLIYAAWQRECAEGGLLHVLTKGWPSKAAEIPNDVIASIDEGDGDYEYVRRMHDGRGAVWVKFHGGMAYVYAAADFLGDAQLLIDEVRRLQQETQPVDDLIGVTFWSYGPHGAQGRYRELTAPSWPEIVENYVESVAESIGEFIDPEFRPGSGGQLMLWSGPPGTGKTTALRALAREWKDWCKVHYVTDPEKFFGAHSDYMLDVLLGGEEMLVTPNGTERPPWRLILLEDTGELLYKDAKDQVSQALSRFLNTVDGLIGQGLRIMILVTTNEEIKELHPAVARPGRCAADVRFGLFDAAEARQWLERHGIDTAPSGRRSLADLYAARHGNAGARTREPVGFAS